MNALNPHNRSHPQYECEKKSAHFFRRRTSARIWTSNARADLTRAIKSCLHISV